MSAGFGSVKDWTGTARGDRRWAKANAEPDRRLSGRGRVRLQPHGDKPCLPSGSVPVPARTSGVDDSSGSARERLRPGLGQPGSIGMCQQRGKLQSIPALTLGAKFHRSKKEPEPDPLPVDYPLWDRPLVAAMQRRVCL